MAVSRRTLLIGGAAITSCLFQSRRAFAHLLIGRNVIDVSQPPFSAIGNGHADDTSRLQGAIDTAERQGGGVIYFPPGRYGVSKALKVMGNNIRLVGEPGQSILTKLNSMNYLHVGDIEKNLLTQEARKVTASVHMGDMRLSVRGNGLGSNQWYVLAESLRKPEKDETIPAEFIHVYAINGEHIELSSPLIGSYEAPALIPVNWVTGIAIDGLSFDGANYLSEEHPNNDNVMTLSWCQSPIIRDVSGWKLPNLFLSLQGCMLAELSGVKVTNGLSANFQGAIRKFSYAVVERGLNMGNVITGIHADRVRHAYTTAHSKLRLGVPMGTRISNSIAIACRGAGFDTHPVGSGITFVNCATLGSLHAGIQVRSSDTQVIGCSAADCLGPGLSITKTASDTVVTDFNSRRTGFGRYKNKIWYEHGAIYDWGLRTNINDATVSDSAGIGVEVSTPANGGIYRNIRVRNPGLHRDGKRIGYQVGGNTLERFIFTDCVAEASGLPLDTGFFVRAENAADGLLSGCKVYNAIQPFDVSGKNVYVTN